MQSHIEIDNLRMTVLGFQDAGWSRYIEHCQQNGCTDYTTSNPIYSSELSIYGRYHPLDALMLKSQHKSKDPKSVYSALQRLGGILLQIKEPLTREAIVKYICYIYRGQESETEEAIRVIERDENPSRAMVGFAIEKTGDSDPILEAPDNLTLTGYSFARRLDEADLNKLFHGKDQGLADMVREWSGYVNIDTKPIQIQQLLAASKRMVVDTLQENLRLLQQGKSVIPIHLVISSERNDKTPLFSPDWERVTKKIGFVLTNAEIRMVYKLMHEIDDPLINQLMTKCVTFIHVTKDNYVPTPPPWANDEKMWRNRTRAKGKPAHRDRLPADIQPWVQELVALSQQTAQQISSRSAQDLDKSIHQGSVSDSTARMLDIMSPGYESKSEPKDTEKSIPDQDVSAAASEEQAKAVGCDTDEPGMSPNN